MSGEQNLDESVWDEVERLKAELKRANEALGAALDREAGTSDALDEMCRDLERANVWAKAERRGRKQAEAELERANALLKADPYETERELAVRLERANEALRLAKGQTFCQVCGADLDASLSKYLAASGEEQA